MTLPEITVVGLGPAGPELITEQTADALSSGKPVWLRTRRHPAAIAFDGAASFDEVYDSSVTTDGVYRSIVESLVEAAECHGAIVYAVPGSPLVAESTVDMLRKDPRVATRSLPAMSFLDLVWDRLDVDPFVCGPRLIDGRRFSTEAAFERGPLLVAQCDARWVMSEIKLAFETIAPESVTVLQHLGLPDEHVSSIDWEDLDRVVDADHLTSLWIPQLAAPVGRELARVTEVARRLRSECPWDREQTHASLSGYLIEEAYELVDAIDAHASVSGGGAEDDDDRDAHLVEELGDVLFQVFAHAAIASEEGRFNIADVAEAIADKLIERHPHVYGDVVAATSDDVMSSWEAQKKASKGRASLMEGIPRHLPALLYASKVLKKANSTGLHIDHRDLALPGTNGALLQMVEDARSRGVDLEEELRRGADALRERFQRAEALADADGIDLSVAGGEVAERYWKDSAT